MMKFLMQHQCLPGKPDIFTDTTAPDWLTSNNSIRESTGDMRWFWERHVLTLPVGKRVQTDFRTITRIA